MTQCNSLNVRLSNSKLNKLKSDIIGNSNYKTNFPHKWLLSNRQVAKLRKAFANSSSTDIKLSIAELSKMIQLGGFLGRLLGPLLKQEYH